MITGLAAIRWQETGKTVSFSLNVTLEKFRIFAFMTSVSSGPLSEYALLQRKDEKSLKKCDTPFITI